MRSPAMRGSDARATVRDEVRRALQWLDGLDRRGGGYLRRGVRGWALLQQIEEGAGPFLGNVGHQLNRRRLVEREDVRAPGRRRPVWILRITEEGARGAHETDGMPDRGVAAPGPRGPDDEAVYLPPGASAALQALRLAAAGAGNLDATGPSGGWTLRGLQRAAEAAGAPAAFPAESLEWLRKRGFAEIRRPREGLRTVVRYRLSPAGRDLRVLDWSEGDR